MKKVFAFLNINYNFNPISVTTDFDSSKVKALKECSKFIKSPYIISCLFYFSQCFLRKFKEYHLINKKLNKNAYELFHNIKLLCFVDLKKLKNIYYFFMMKYL